MRFANACIFDKMAWPENDDWVRDLIYKMKEKRKELDKKINLPL